MASVLQNIGEIDQASSLIEIGNEETSKTISIEEPLWVAISHDMGWSGVLSFGSLWRLLYN